MISRLLILLSLGCFTLVDGGFLKAANVDDFIDFSSAPVPGRLYVPPEAADDPRPLILFLHGAGETGSDKLKQINGNIDNLLDGAKERGAFLYAPQAMTFSWAGVTRATSVMAKIDQAIDDFNVDPDRLYVTGLSMGGGGAWNMLKLFSDRFAAGVPVAGVSPGSYLGFPTSNLVGKPTWAFHARNDNVVSPVASRQTVDSILSAAGAAPIDYPPLNAPFTTLAYTSEPVGLRYTEWATGGHGIWGRVYETPEMYDWMFSKTLGVPGPVIPAPVSQVRVHNIQLVSGRVGDFFPIANHDGELIGARTGFVAVGTVDLPDAEVAATNHSSLAALDDAFSQFGLSIQMGANGIGGFFSGDIGASLQAGNPLVGKNMYVVAGDGSDIPSSESLLVFKSDQVFETGDPVSIVDLSLHDGINMGAMLLGATEPIFVNLLGREVLGARAAFVGVPEPAAAVLVAMGGLAVVRARRR